MADGGREGGVGGECRVHKSNQQRVVVMLSGGLEDSGAVYTEMDFLEQHIFETAVEKIKRLLEAVLKVNLS